MKIVPGLYIRHTQYGLGVVLSSDDERTSIDFDNHGKKIFVTNLMVIEAAEGTPPRRPGQARSRQKKTASAATARPR